MWWRHLRAPREHVAEYDIFAHESVYDMSELLFDLNESPFYNALHGEWVTRHVETCVGEFFVHDGKWHKALKVRVISPDDWFEPKRWEVCVSEPTFIESKYYWIEDEFMSRIIKDPATRTGTVVLTNITDDSDVVNWISG